MVGEVEFEPTVGREARPDAAKLLRCNQEGGARRSGQAHQHQGVVRSELPAAQGPSRLRARRCPSWGRCDDQERWRVVMRPMPRTSPTPSAERRMRVMSRVGRQATRPSWISNAPAGQAAKPSPMPAPVVGSPASVSCSLDPLLPPPPPPPPITVAAGITVTASRSTGSPKTWRALSASRSDLNASCGSTGSVFAYGGPDPASRPAGVDLPVPTGASAGRCTRPRPA